MNVGQKETVASLRLLLYNRPLHPELFEIYCDHRVTRAGYEAHFWVTGCSHLIGLYRDGGSAVELTACAEAELPKRGRLLDVPIRGERYHYRNPAEGINYMMSFQVESMSPAVYAKTHQELVDQSARGGVFVSLDNQTSGPLTPFTYIDYDARVSRLHVFAYHAFPQELTIVKTLSLFELD